MSKGSVLGYCRSRKRGTFFVAIFSVLFFVVAVSVGFLLLKSSSRVEPTLRFLSIIHRHGQRSPESSYPLDPYKNNESAWPNGLQQLVQKGKITMFEVGKFLRHRYDGFIPSKYKSTEVSVISSSYDRCVMSAQLLLAGLYPPVGNQIWNKDLLWQPIPVFSLPESYDDMIRITQPCALLLKEEEYVNTNFIRKKLNEKKEVLDYLSKNTGLEVKSIRDVVYVYDNLMTTEEHGLKLPEWAPAVYPDKMKEFHLIRRLASFATPTMLKLLSGVLINEILSNMKKKAAGKFDRLINLYSAHDNTIVRLWRGMNILQEITEVPGYGAMFIIELHEINGKYRVKILYKDHAASNKEMTVLTVRGCENDQSQHQDGMCDLDVFSSVLQPMAITDFDNECQIPR